MKEKQDNKVKSELELPVEEKQATIATHSDPAKREGGFFQSILKRGKEWFNEENEDKAL